MNRVKLPFGPASIILQELKQTISREQLLIDLSINKLINLRLMLRTMTSVKLQTYLVGFEDVDSHLTFNHHISNILAKATHRVGVFFRGFSSRHIALMKKAFITYIRPSLEFNSNIWNPTKKYIIEKLESI